MKQLLLIAMLAVILAGCATSPNYSSKAMSLEMGMTKPEVIGLLGPPKKTSARTDNGQMIERYSWWAPKMVGFTAVDNEMISPDRITVKFVDGKVTEWGDSYDPGAMTERSIEMQKEMLESMQRSFQQPVQE